MPHKKIKAVLFDLGETLLNFGRINLREIFRRSAELTYEFLQNLNQPVSSFRWYYWRSIIAVRFNCLISNLIRKDFNDLSLLEKIGASKGIVLNEDQWRQLGWLWYEPLSKLAQIEPGLKATLALLKQRGIKLGIVSNTFISTSSLDRQLAQFDILDFFPVRLYSHQFDFRKPDLRIFKAASERIGEMPEDIMFVGDRIDTDIKPAVKAGMQAVLKEAYTNIGKRIPKGVWRISRLSELPGLIEEVNCGTMQAKKSVILNGIEPDEERQYARGV
jgi:putative hydrolase of the HAD superfamily